MIKYEADSRGKRERQDMATTAARGSGLPFISVDLSDESFMPCGRTSPDMSALTTNLAGAKFGKSTSDVYRQELLVRSDT